ncbi:MAG: membrane protein insertase YidC [Thermodesulfobacteriota bacterium]
MENNKRVLLAIVLCLGVLIAWQYFFPQNALIQKAPQEQGQQASPAPAKPAGKPDAAMAAAEPLPGQPIVITTPLYKATLLNTGGVLQHFSLSKYKLSMAKDSPNMDLVSGQSGAKAPMGLIVDGKASWRDAQWTTGAKDTTVEPGKSVTLTFDGVLGGLTIKRELTFHADKYEIDESVTLVSQTAQVTRLAFTLAAGSLTGGEDNYNPTLAAYFAKSLETYSSLDDLKDGKVVESGGKWAAVESNYFISALIPSGEAILKLQHTGGVTRLAAEKDGISLAPGQPAQIKNSYYLGPKERGALAQAPGNLQAALDYGWFHVLAEACLWLLHFLYGYVHNYGVAIIILTVIIKLLFWPLSQKSYQSMEKMRKLQPMMAAIREKHGEDRQKMNEELMQLYKTYKVNPAGGCLPILVQIPVFFGLYQALLNSIELRHAPFIAHVPFTSITWLADLSAKDPFYVTPLIMGATMFIQQKMSPPPGDPTQAKIMLFMPVIFTFMFLNFPSGLVIYWLVNNVLSIAQQGLLMKGSAQPAAKKA